MLTEHELVTELYSYSRKCFGDIIKPTMLQMHLRMPYIQMHLRMPLIRKMLEGLPISKRMVGCT